jgi:hypothetical protein
MTLTKPLWFGDNVYNVGNNFSFGFWFGVSLLLMMRMEINMKRLLTSISIPKKKSSHFYYEIFLAYYSSCSVYSLR